MMEETLRDKFYNWIASRLPRRIVYHAVIRVWAGVTTTKYTAKTPDEVTWDMALSAWMDGHGK